MGWERRFSHTTGWPVGDPVRYLAAGVISFAVDDARLTRRWGRPVTIDPWWPDVAGVPRKWLTDEGIVVADRTAVRAAV